MNKLKKLVLKKEVINRINDNQMNRLRGGNICQVDPDSPKNCICSPTSEYDTLAYGDCPYNTSDGVCDYGDEGRTCGAAHTCNGR